MTWAQRFAWHLTLALLAVAGSVVAMALARTNTPASVSASTYYGASDALMTEALQNIWPQASNYCGVEAALGAVNYADLWRGIPEKFNSVSNQYWVGEVDDWKAHAISEWGYATPANAYAGKSNIAADAGTDPRSIAYMTHWYAGTTGGYYFHDYIYRWQMFYHTEPSWNTQVAEATSSLAHSLMYYKQPVDATINGGAHSVLVTGVFATSNPRYYWPANIQEIVYRDPEYAAWNSRFEVSFSTWADTGLYLGGFRYTLWAFYYGDLDKRGDHKNRWDPEPKVGPYVPQPTKGEPSHWYNGFTWIARDSFATSPDWSYTAPLPSSWGTRMTSP